MAKKPKGFGASLQPKREAREHQKLTKRFKQQVSQGPLRDVKLIDNPAGETKMSEVLEAFVAPYLDFTEDRDETMMLLTIAVAAWNIALLPPERRKQETDSLMSQVFNVTDRRGEQDMRSFLMELVKRKLSLFADNRRRIVDFQLQPLKRGELHLSVVSTLPDQAPADASLSEPLEGEAVSPELPEIES